MKIFAHARYACLALAVICTIAKAQAADLESQQLNSAQAIVDKGIELERERKWIQAIQLYEAGERKFPIDGELRRRLLISRLHYDVVRRLTDSSIGDLVRNVTEAEALELYSEVLARLEMSYVDKVDMTEIVRGGTAYLEVALTEPNFLASHLSGQSRERIEQFRTSIHRQTLARTVSNRFDARNIVSQAAKSAERSVNLRASTTIMQFVFGAVALLDPYSSFMSPAELNEVESQIEGNFVGLGIALQPHEVPLQILNVIPGGPALEAGVRAGDRILKIGSVVCAEVGAEKAADLLRGPENSRVRLAMLREDGSNYDCVVVRRRVEVPSVEDVKIVDPTAAVGYLKISSFQKTTARELDDALWNLQKQGMQSLIIDLRGNPGGWLDASVSVADRFLNNGGIVRTRGKNGIENQNYRATSQNTWNMPLVLMIDDESASASEILAGAIRDNHRGVLVGERSYGKGSVQGLFHTRSLGTGIRLTVSKFYSPSGMAISRRGVSPTVPINDVHFVAKPDYSAPEPVKDKMLHAAIMQARDSVASTPDAYARH